MTTPTVDELARMFAEHLADCAKYRDDTKTSLAGLYVKFDRAMSGALKWAFGILAAIIIAGVTSAFMHQETNVKAAEAVSTAKATADTSKSDKDEILRKLDELEAKK